MKGEEEGEGVGIPLLHQGDFVFLEFKISDLVHTLGEIYEISSIENLRRYTVGQGIRKICGGEGCGRGCPPPTPGSFCICRVQNKRFGAYFG